MLVVNLGCSPHVEQRGEVGFCRSCLSMRHRMPRKPYWQVKRKDVIVIGGLSKIDHAPFRKRPCSDDDPPKLNGGKDFSFKCDDRISCISKFRHCCQCPYLRKLEQPLCW